MSPSHEVAAPPPWLHGSMPGMVSRVPSRTLVPRRRFARWIVSTLTWKRRAMRASVSPERTT
ncbi:MAG: hypothetical protein R3B82_22710 [Sandaracinaceae bacterium]